MHSRPAIWLALSCLLMARVGQCGDWITEPSYFTHGPDGKRVQQHTPIGPFYVYVDPTFQRSGYRHTRSSLQFGGSVDHYHQVEEWGRPVRPYDEWRFPYRPYSVPYDQWGPPYGGLGPTPFFPWGAGAVGPYGNGAFLGGGFGGSEFYGGDFRRRYSPGLPYPGYQPWQDDRYPAFDDRAPWRHQPFPVVPNGGPIPGNHPGHHHPDTPGNK